VSKTLAALDLAITVVPGADVTKLLEVGVKGAAKAGGEQAAFALVRWIAGKTDSKVAADLSDNVLRDAFRSRKEGGSSALRDAERAACEACFTAGTRVATPHGGQAIESLHVGDMVLSENPTTGKVEAEPVQAVIQDPVSPLVAVDLSDGSAITVTADHPFWVDAGARLGGPGWFAAGRLQAGDELRTASGAHVMVVGLRHNVGHAVVYTLTVARDHTFFVGIAQVLVHNCALTYEGSPKHHSNADPGIGDAPANGQATLDNSVQVKSTSPRRVGVDPATGEIAVFDETHPGQKVFHGHVRTWDQLTQEMKNALQRAGLVDKRGRLIK